MRTLLLHRTRGLSGPFLENGWHTQGNAFSAGIMPTPQPLIPQAQAGLPGSLPSGRRGEAQAGKSKSRHKAFHPNHGN